MQGHISATNAGARQTFKHNTNMKTSNRTTETGSTLISTVCVIAIISLIGANVLMNCTTRYNATSKQVKAWKEALYAAEAGADIGYAECRKLIFNPSNPSIAGSQWDPTVGWTVLSSPPDPAWQLTPPPFGESNTLSSVVTVDQFGVDPESNSSLYYRIRSTGTARVLGLRRTGMDDRVGLTTRGDSLLRKIDFNYDHFKATYGDGDGNNIQLVSVSNPQISRRIELIAVPVAPFEGFLKVLGSFYGPGSAGVVDSYDSKNGAYILPEGSVAANPASPFYSDSRNGNVAINSSVVNVGNIIYGDVGTNGANITHSNSTISGTIDNSISFTVPPMKEPTPPAGWTGTNTSTPITPTAAAINPNTPDWYHYTAGFNGRIRALNDGAGNPVETFVTIVVTGGNIATGSGITIDQGVNAVIYFTGNLSAKARDLVNNNVEGTSPLAIPPGVTPGNTTKKAVIDRVTHLVVRDPVTNLPLYVATDNPSRAAHLQFNAINPPDGVVQTIDITPPGSFWATVYAPGADFSMNGNPDMYGAAVVKSFYGNGNTGFHFDKSLRGKAGPPVEYRVASYIEDIR
jgi:hypothetical protein